MNSAMHLAGSLAAHAVWCVSDGETLIPMLGHTGDNGQRVMERLVHDRLEDAVADGQRRLDARLHDTPIAVLLYDGYITLPSDKSDAILIDIRSYDPGTSGRMLMAVPYKRKRFLSRFVVYKPKFLDCSLQDPKWEDLTAAFFAGVDSHERAATVWNKHIDQSR